MTPEHIVLAGLGCFALACLYWAIKSPAGKAAVAKFDSQHPLIAAFEKYDRDALKQAAEEISAEMTSKRAAEIKAKMAGAFGPKSPSGSDAGS